MISICFLTFLFSLANSSAIAICNTDYSGSDEYYFVPDLSTFEIVIGTLILIFTTLSIVPQIIKIIRRKTSEGLSPTYLFLMVCNQVFAATNATILNYSVMDSCPEIGISKCFPPLLSYFQFLSLVVMGFITYTLFLIFYPEKHTITFKRVVVYYVIIILFFIGTSTMIALCFTVIGICEPFTESFAFTFGVISSIVTFVEYLPQIWKTFWTKKCGSMSLLANSFQTFGFLVVLCFMVFSTEQHITTILSSIVSLIQHSILVMLQIKYDYIDYYLCKNKYKELDSPEEIQNDESQRLITEDFDN